MPRADYVQFVPSDPAVINSEDTDVYIKRIGRQEPGPRPSSDYSISEALNQLNQMENN